MTDLTLDGLARIEIFTRERLDGQLAIVTLLDGVEIPDAHVQVDLQLDAPSRVKVNGVEINGAFVYRNGDLLCTVPRRPW